MRSPLILLSLLCTLNVFGQQALQEDSNTIKPISELRPSTLMMPFWQDQKSSVRIFGEFTEASSSMPRSMQNKLLFGGFIDEDIKTKGLDRASELNNQIAYHFSTGVQAGIALDTSWHLLIRGAYQFYQEVEFTRGLYELVFFGNADMLGETASLQDSRVQYYVVQQIDFGASKSWAWDNNKLQASAWLGLVQGVSHAHSEFSGQFFTASDVSSLELEASGYVLRSNSGAADIFDWNGTGFQGGLQIGWQKQLDDRSSLAIQAELDNLGWVNWSSPGFRYDFDSTWIYDGLQVSELTDLAAGAISTETDSLLDYLGLTQQEGSYSESMPAIASVHAQYQFGDWMGHVGTRIRMQSAADPLIYLGAARSLGDVQLGSYLAYGGWGALQWGLDVQYQWKDLQLRLGSTDVLAYLLPNEFGGGTLFTSIGWQF
jgi:hypothetical protein